MDEQVKILVTDLDGVLTDGRLTINHDGTKMFKQFHTRDVRAIREFIANGWEVWIISADGHNSGREFAKKVGADFLELRDKSQWTPGRPYICVGDDAWDIPMLKNATKAYCPQDADREVMRIPGIEILGRDGGQGVISELLFQIYEYKPFRI